MAESWDRKERCGGCGALLRVPPRVRSIWCARCRAATDVWWPRSFTPASTRQPSTVANSDCGGGGGGSDVIVRLPGGGFPAAHGKKRALLCGVSYVGTRYELKGSINDVNCMRFLLRDKFNFLEQSILVLTEEENEPCRIPTKENLRAAMRWLMNGCAAGDSLVFHFSGHGSQRPCPAAGDEADGFDETICPVDYLVNGVILDDELNNALVRPLPVNSRLHAVVDSCHSGTVLDLPYLCRMNRSGFYQWKEQRAALGAYKGTNGGLSICFSGCDDNQTSADTSALSRSVTTGAMTYSFIQAVESGTGMTYGRILAAMRAAIRGADAGGMIAGGGGASSVAAFLRRLVFSSSRLQEPQLCSSEKFDIYRKPLIL